MNLKSRETPTRKLQIDIVGLSLLVVWVGSLQVMLDQGKDLDWFHSTEIVVLAVVTAIGFAAFLIWELTEKNPIVDLSLFKGRNFAFGTLAFCLGYAVFFACNLLMPLWLQTQVGYTATWAGLVAAPTGVIAVLLTPLSARLMTRIDARILATVAFIAFGVSYLMRANFTNEASFLDYTLPLLVQGIAMATFFLVHADYPADAWRAAAAHSAGLGPFQLYPHHGRWFCRLDCHHPVGPSRGAASEPHDRSHHRFQPQPGGDRPSAPVGPARGRGAGGGGAWS